MNLVAKPVSSDYWVVTGDSGKVGNVVAHDGKYQVNVHGSTSYFDTTQSIKKKTHIEFVRNKPTGKKEIPWKTYPTTPRVFNSLYDVRKKIHLYTKTAKSKCYYAAGWFRVESGVVFCPKYIFIQRYEYTGPFKTAEEAAR
jgi:hypothetical protein